MQIRPWSIRAGQRKLRKEVLRGLGESDEAFFSFGLHLKNGVIFASGFPSVELEVLNAMRTTMEKKSDEFR